MDDGVFETPATSTRLTDVKPWPMISSVIGRPAGVLEGLTAVTASGVGTRFRTAVTSGTSVTVNERLPPVPVKDPRHSASAQPVLVASVWAKRAVLRLRSNLPYTGALSGQVCQRRFRSGLRSARRHIQNAATSRMPT